MPGRADAVVAAAADRGVNLRRVDADTVGISTDEITTREHLELVWSAFGVPVVSGDDLDALDAQTVDAFPAELRPRRRRT